VDGYASGGSVVNLMARPFASGAAAAGLIPKNEYSSPSHWSGRSMPTVARFSGSTSAIVLYWNRISPSHVAVG